MPLDQSNKSAQLYRMMTDAHTCPYGLKSKDLLERKGFDVEDHPLRTREETDAFMEKHGVETTPQTFIEGDRIGGYEALRVHLGLDKPEDEQSDTTYRPVIGTASRPYSRCGPSNGSFRFPCVFWRYKNCRTSKAFQQCF